LTRFPSPCYKRRQFVVYSTIPKEERRLRIVPLQTRTQHEEEQDMFSMHKGTNRSKAARLVGICLALSSMVLPGAAIAADAPPAEKPSKEARLHKPGKFGIARDLAAGIPLKAVINKLVKDGVNIHLIIADAITEGVAPSLIVYTAITEGYAAQTVVAAALKAGAPLDAVVNSATVAGADKKAIYIGAAEAGAPPAAVANAITTASAPPAPVFGYSAPAESSPTSVYTPPAPVVVGGGGGGTPSTQVASPSKPKSN
jgi:hypothetical protein